MIKRVQAIITAVLVVYIYLWFPATVVYAESAETPKYEEQENAASPEGDYSGIFLNDTQDDAGAEGNIAPEPENARQLGDTMNTLDETTEPESPVSDEEPEEDEPAEDIIVFAAMIDCSEDAFVLECFGDARSLALENVAYAQYGRFDFVACEVIWRYDEFDNITPGRRMIVGDIVLPPGYAFENEPLTVQSPVIVYDPAGEPTEKLASCIISTIDKPILIPLGAGYETLEGYFAGLMDEAILITESGDYFYCPVALDLDAIDTSVEGVYYPIVIDLPGGLTFGGQEFYMIGVHVIPDGVVTLSAVKWWRNGYSIKWLYPASEPILWVSVDEGNWFLPDTWAEGSYNMYGYFKYTDDGCVNELLLFYNNLPTGHIYKFQVQYDGNRFSNVVELDLVNNSLPKSYFDIDGDRNGGDRDENSLPDTSNSGSGTPAISDTDNLGNGAPTISGTDNLGNGTPTTTETGNPGNETPTMTETGNPGNETPTTTETSNPGNETPTMTETGKPGNGTPTTTETGNPSNGITTTTEASNPGNGMPAALEASNPVNGTLTMQDTGNPGSETQQSAPMQLAATEEYTDDRSVAVSGQRLAVMMAANPEYVSFLRGDLRASIPTAFLESLDLALSDFFTVTLYKPQETTFFVSFAVNGNEISYTFSQPFFVSLPWNGDSVSCEGEDYETIDAELDIRASRANFALRKTGTYTMTEQAATVISGLQNTADIAPTQDTASAIYAVDAETSGMDGLVSILLVGAVGLTGAGAFLWFSRKRLVNQP